MISSPVYYHRQFDHDVPSIKEGKIGEKIQKIIRAALPILSFYTPIRAPLSFGMGTIRCFTHLQGLAEGIEQGNSAKISLSCTHVLLSLTALSLAITAFVTRTLNPSYALLLTGVDDLLSNIFEITRAFKEGDYKQVAETTSHLISSLLYLSFISFGHIEILATCMLLQIAFNIYKSGDEFLKGNYIEALCHLIVSTLTLRQVIPQMKVVEWKWRHGPTLEGKFYRDSRGYVYVKIDDKIIYELNKVFGDSSLPPYFGKGGHGAHITVGHVGEFGNGAMPEIGSTIKFNIAFCDTVTPFNFKGVDQVSFLSLYAPQLDAIRAKYGLTEKIAGAHDWHITFGVHYEK